MLGLLEDLRLYADHQPKRTEPNYFCEGPYYGDVLSSPKGVGFLEKENINTNRLTSFGR